MLKESSSWANQTGPEMCPRVGALGCCSWFVFCSLPVHTQGGTWTSSDAADCPELRGQPYQIKACSV